MSFVANLTNNKSIHSSIHYLTVSKYKENPLIIVPIALYLSLIGQRRGGARGSNIVRYTEQETEERSGFNLKIVTPNLSRKRN